MAKLVDALDLGSSALRLGGSSPSARTPSLTDLKSKSCTLVQLFFYAQIFVFIKRFALKFALWLFKEIKFEDMRLNEFRHARLIY